MSRVRQEIEAFNKLGSTVLAISVDTPTEARAFKEELELPFQVLSDEQRIAIDGYGATDSAERNGKTIAKVATVIINPENEVVYKYVGTHWSDRPTEEKMLAVLTKIRNGI